MYVVIVILFVASLLLFDMFSLPQQEGMETKDDCDAQLQTTVFKNAGSIANLEEKITSIMNQINNIMTMNDKQSAQIGNMSELQDKYDKIAQEAETTAKSNAEKILDIVKQAQKKGAAAQNAQKQLAPIQ